MKTLVIGLGVIGQRHQAILTKLGHDTFTVSAHNPESATNFHCLFEAINKIRPEYVVVSNETSLHLETLLELEKLKFKGKVLVEKPLEFGLERSNFMFKKIGVGFNLRYLTSIIELKKLISESDIKIFTAEFYYGNLFSNWRSANRITTQYSSLKSKGGGVLRDFSHEIDLIIWLFGIPKINFSIGGRIGEVTVDSDDCWQVSASTNLVPIISLHLNSLDSIPKREIRLLTSLGTIYVDVLKNQITSFKGEVNFSGGIDGTYELMHKDMIDNEGELIATINQSLEVDRLIYAIESIVDRE
jgi:predicted dehydrogenase